MRAGGLTTSRQKIRIAAIVLLILGCSAIGLSMADSALAQHRELRKGAKKGGGMGGQVAQKRLQAGPKSGRNVRNSRANSRGNPNGFGGRRFNPGGRNSRAANIRNFNSRGPGQGLNATRGNNARGLNSRFGNARGGIGNARGGNSNRLTNRSGNSRGSNARGANPRVANTGVRATLGGRQRLRADHRREILAVQRRLAARPLPGQRGFTGVPPTGERRFRTTEMMFRIGANVSQQTVDAAARRLGLTAVATQSSSIAGGTLYRFRFADGRQITDVVGALENERIGVAQPNYVYQLLQSEASIGNATARSEEQYVVSKLRLDEIHKIATGSNVVVAVIDSQVDARHPDLAGAIVDQFDAVGRPEKPHVHGTGMAGAIAAHLRLMGIAPGAKILAVHAFSTEQHQSAEATTQNILAGLDWAIAKGARVINMSFAGPYDPILALAMKNAHDKGVVLIAAVGNAGPTSPPLYPAADPNVIAVTATDENDKLFAQANQGPQVAIAAPGVDIVEPAPGNTYQVTTGTSVAAAHVSGVAALLIGRHPEVDASTILEVLTASARKVGDKDRDDQFGWGLIDPESALEELDARVNDNKVASSGKADTSTPASFTSQ